MVFIVRHKGVSAHHAIMMYLFAAVNGLVQNAVRAVPFGQNTGVQAMHELIRPVTEAAKLVGTLTVKMILAIMRSASNLLR